MTRYEFDFEGHDRRMQVMNLYREISQLEDPYAATQHMYRSHRQLFGELGYMIVSVGDLPAGQYRIIHFEHSVRLAASEAAAPWQSAPQKVYSEGFLSDVLKRCEPIILRNVCVDADPVLGSLLAPYHTITLCPSFRNGQIQTWFIHMSDDSDDLSAEVSEHVITEIILSAEVINAKHIARKLRAATDWINREIDEIALLQQGMLPQSIPQIEKLRCATHYATFDRAGGDFYDMFPVGPCSGPDANHPQWAVFVADASGHGPSAAVIVAVLSTLLHEARGTRLTPGELIADLNRHLVNRSFRYSFATAYLAYIDTDAETLTYTMAGHPCPFIKREGAWRTLDPLSGLPLGVRHDGGYEERTIPFRSGDSLLVYTDGLSEASGPGGALFGGERILTAIKSAGDSPESLIESILDALRHHEGTHKPNDDQTMVAIHRV